MTEQLQHDLLPEYKFDYSKARPNRFADEWQENQIAIVLDPDVAAVFQSAEEVNRVLRALIRTMPPVSTKSGEQADASGPASHHP